jgi:PAS domain S-box-containing protein
LIEAGLTNNAIANHHAIGLLECIDDMLIFFDLDFRVLSVNQKACQLLNQKEERLINTPINDLFLKRQGKFLEQLLDDINLEEHISNRETRLKVRGRKSLPVSVSLSWVKKDNVPEGFLLIGRDIGQLLMATDALKQKNRELETLIYRVSHDLKGPLASVTGLFQLLEHEEETLETLRYYLSLIQESTGRLENALSGLLETRLFADGVIQHQKFNVRRVIEDVIATFSGYPGYQEVIILISANCELTLNTEEQAFRSVLQNIIENSIKYRKHYAQDSVTKISARKYKNGIKLKIKDNGQGMTKQVQGRAFDMFYRGNQTSKGSGLGLFIVRSNVEKLGGEVRIKSRVDHGTELWLYLPNIDVSRRKSLLNREA